ncbi:MAG TPA: hypothetical protein VFQ39_04075, partial [Longimicrobium sp.]|nr:hypothetical protein [Longimicrobium sp.]
GLDGVNVTGMGATLAIAPGRVWKPGETMNAFLFTGCSNVVVDGFNCTGPDLPWTGEFRGVAFVHLQGRNTNVRMPTNRVRGWLAGLAITRWKREQGGDEVLRGRATNIEVGMLEASNGTYGINCAFNGDGLRVGRLKTDRVVRSYFAYGVRDHRLSIEARNNQATDVVLTSYGEDGVGRGCEDIDITLVDHETDDTRWEEHFKVVIGFNQEPTVHRNIRLRLDLAYPPGARNSGGPALRIEKRAGTQGAYDTRDRGHVLENLTVSGTIRGRPTFEHEGLLHTERDCAWGVAGPPDRWSNFLFQNLRIDSPTPSDLVLDALDRLTLMNVHSTAPIALRGQGTRQTTRRARIEAVNSDAPNLHEVVRRGVAFYPVVDKALEAPRAAVPEAWSGSPVDNRLLAQAADWTLPPARPGLEYTFTRVAPHAVEVRPAGRDRIRGRGAGEAVRLAAEGAALRLRCVERGTWEIVSARGTSAPDDD